MTQPHLQRASHLVRQLHYGCIQRMVNLLHYIKNDKDNEDNPKNKVDPKNKDNLNEDAIKNEDDIAGTLCPPNMSLEFKVEILWMWGGA